MKNFIAYHKVAEWGPYKPDGITEFQHYSGHPRSKLEKTIGQNVWVVSGTKISAKTTYKLCAIYQPTHIEESNEGGFLVIGNGTEFNPQIELTNLPWLKDLLKEQRNFSYGLNKIHNIHIIEGLQQLKEASQVEFHLPDELPASKLLEGAKQQIFVNIYERSPVARAMCIAHYGWSCWVCGFNFEKQYGEIGKRYIHIHHLTPLSVIGDTYEVDPVRDLRPVCPNCHAMLHKKQPPFTVEELRGEIKIRFTEHF